MSFTLAFQEKVLSQYMDGRSQAWLEKRHGVSRPTIAKWIKRAGLKEHWYKARYLDKEGIARMYADGLSVLKIAKELGTGRRPVETILKDAGIRKRDQREALLGRYGGKRNPNYKGGNALDLIRAEMPGIKQVLSVWAKIVVSLDGFRCQMCDDDSSLMEANHIVSVRRIYRDRLDRSLLTDLGNGIALCRKCHLSIHMKENEHEERFKNLVKHRVNSVEPLQQYLSSLLTGQHRA